VQHPEQFDPDDTLLEELRRRCLALPGAAEKVSHGRPVFFTTKIFAIFGAVVKGDHADDRHARSVLFLVPEDERQALDQDERIFVPAYWGPYGWRGMDLAGDGVDWDEVAELVEESYRQTAPKRLIAQLDERGAG
jgi:predicted DNA-binding protein (MmcQ/YjbR family)